MLLFNEKHEQLNVRDVKAKLLDLSKVPVPTEEEVNAALGDYYNQSLQLQGARLQFKAELTPLMGTTAQAAFLPGIGGKILTEIKKIICAILDGNSTQSDILDAVLNALASIIPGGVLVETLAKIVVKFILSTGIGAFCQNVAA